MAFARCFRFLTPGLLLSFCAGTALAGTPPPAPAVLPALSIGDFIRTYVRKDAAHELAQARLERAQAQLSVDEDLFQSTLSLTPAYSRTEQRYFLSNVISRDFGMDVAAQLTQKTPIGLQLGLKGSKSYSNGSELSQTLLDHRYSLTLDLPLYRNSLGSGDRLKAQSSRKASEAAQAELDEQALRSCQEGATLYLRAWALSEKTKLLEQAALEAQQALRTAETAHQRKLSRRIDWLNAQSDHLRLQNVQASARAEGAEASARIRSFADPTAGTAALPPSPDLTDPSPFMSSPLELAPPASGLRSRELEAKELLAASAGLATDSVRNLSRSSVDFFAEAGRSRGRTVTSRLEDFSENYVKAGIQLSLPLVNRTNEGALTQALAGQRQAEAQLAAGRRELRASQESLPQVIQSLEDRLSRQEKEISLRREQLSEATRLMESGRMEFEEYLRYRDSHLTPLLEGLELKLKLWEAKSAWARLTGARAYLCGSTGSETGGSP